MHEASWPRVKWLRLSWSAKDFLTACGSVLFGTVSRVSSRLVSSCVVLLGPLGNRSGTSFGSLGGLLGAGPLGPILAALGPLLGRSWPDLRPLLAPLGPVLGPPGPLLGPLEPLLAAKTEISREPYKTL